MLRTTFKSSGYRNKRRKKVGQNPAARLQQMNMFDWEPRRSQAPTVGSICPGKIFQFPSGNALYIRTDNARVGDYACVHLGTGVLYWCDGSREVILLEAGTSIRITVNNL